MKLYPYNPGSKSAKSLAEALDIKRIKHAGKALKLRDIVINWGCSSWTRSVECEEVLNRPESVARAVNKLQAFKAMQGYASIPEFTEDRTEALEWLAEGFSVVARTKLCGHSGEGIEIAGMKGDYPQKNLVEAPLYVKYIEKKEEYRLHVFRDKVFFVQRKARNREVPDDKVNWKVRNHGNGFIFAHKDVDVPDVAKQEAIAAVAALGLDFGAVDLIWNQKKDKYYVLEVNTAGGLEGTTLEKYVEIFKEFV